jgi:hypothetical protein
LVGNTGSTGTYSVQNAITANGSYKAINIASFTKIQVMATAAITGTANVGIVAAAPSQRLEVIQLNAANLNATVSGSVAVTDLPVIQAISTSDFSPATQNITVIDTGTTSTTYAITATLNQTRITGTPTTGSAATFAVSSAGSVSFETAQVIISGTWTGTLQVETSADGGATYVSHSLHVISTSLFAATFTTNVEGSLNMGGKTHLRVRAIAAMTGTATVGVNFSSNPTSVYVANSLRITDGANPITAQTMSVKAASTPALPADMAAVVTTQRASTLNTGQVSVGNTPTLIIAANTSRKRITIVNLGTTNVFIGGSGVTTTTGQLLQGLAGYPLTLYCTSAIYGVATPNQTVSYSEEAI